MVNLLENNHRDQVFVIEWPTQRPENTQHPWWADPDWYLDQFEEQDCEEENE